MKTSLQAKFRQVIFDTAIDDNLVAPTMLSVNIRARKSNSEG